MPQVIRRFFDSITDFLKFFEDNSTPNQIFRHDYKLSSQDTHRAHWHGTANWEEAISLIKNGWDDMAKKLENRLNVKMNEMNITRSSRKPYYDVVGFQASVPRYLQGIPTNMINQKTVVQKQRVITIAKDILYSAMYTQEQIIESSTKALQIVKAIEAKGVRVNLSVFQYNGGRNSRQILFTNVKIKDSSERLNVSKLAFPMVHPSMFRRLFFRHIEVEPQLTDSYTFHGTYGHCENDVDYIKKQNPELKDTYILPLIIKDVDAVLKEWGFQ
ncbi:MAG: hypothetical protein N3B21_19485 [Clostridia bacterium]|nr:hypothetical protein [Clostridia bacterium]